jgi:hypothetical protein
MLRTLFMIGLFAVLGLFALKVVFGILPVFFGILMGLLWWAAKIALFGGLIYLLIRIFSPDTARKLRERFSGTPSY